MSLRPWRSVILDRLFEEALILVYLNPGSLAGTPQRDLSSIFANLIRMGRNGNLSLQLRDTRSDRVFAEELAEFGDFQPDCSFHSGGLLLDDSASMTAIGMEQQDSVFPVTDGRKDCGWLREKPWNPDAERMYVRPSGDLPLEANIGFQSANSLLICS